MRTTSSALFFGSGEFLDFDPFFSSAPLIVYLFPADSLDYSHTCSLSILFRQRFQRLILKMKTGLMLPCLLTRIDIPRPRNPRI
jgi:hypothetical protein